MTATTGRQRPAGLALGVVATSAAAWAVLLWVAGTGALGGLDHRLLAEALSRPEASRPELSRLLLVPDGPGPVAAALLAGSGWLVMVLAMMLPPALPMFRVLRDLVARTRRPGPVVLAGAVSFVAVWAAVGVLLVAADLALHLATAGRPWWPAHPTVLLGAVLLLAGGYQLSRFKDACLRACRSPRGFAVAHWQGRRSPWREAATVTGRYGLACAGCCWALMAVGFAAGSAALPLMVLLALLTAAERLAPGGRRLVRPAGVAAVLAGTALLALPVVS